MCAIFGFIDTKGYIPYRTMRRFTQKLANAAEERGTDSAGIAYVNNGKMIISKKPKSAHKINFFFPYGTRAVLGHTRYATQGDKKFNFNNHPFPGKAGNTEFAMAHNGVLYNDKLLRKEYNLPDTEIETDSYIAVQLAESKGRLDFDSLKFVAEEISGSFVLTYLDTDNNLYIVKGDNPLYLVYFENLGLYVYASTKSIFENAIKNTQFANCKHSVIKVDEGEIIKISTNGKFERLEFESSSYFDALCRQYKFYNYDWYSNDDYCTLAEEELLSVCNMYGFTEDVILMLLDYGYTSEEIEDMLPHAIMLSEVIKEVREYFYCDETEEVIYN